MAHETVVIKFLEAPNVDVNIQGQEENLHSIVVL
jgi:hypothetical protein